nr:MAG TPA_asm: hypothetical protein [Caudoviricetes sp.]
MLPIGKGCLRGIYKLVTISNRCFYHTGTGLVIRIAVNFECQCRQCQATAPCLISYLKGNLLLIINYQCSICRSHQGNHGLHSLLDGKPQRRSNCCG